jgi:hypothetical protein
MCDGAGVTESLSGPFSSLSVTYVHTTWEEGQETKRTGYLCHLRYFHILMFVQVVTI